MSEIKSSFKLLTPPGMGGVAVLFICGHEAESFLRSHFKPYQEFPKTSRASVGRLKSSSETIDECILIRTGEREFELHTHASSAVISSVIDLMLEYGFRGLEQESLPSGYADDEFLSKAETQRTAALFTGSLPSVFASCVENWSTMAENGAFSEFAKQLEKLAQSYWVADLIVKPPRVVFFGRPNAGKSSLFNAMLGFSRVITSDIEGTTHDVIWEQIALRGFPVFIADSPGFGGFDSWAQLLDNVSSSSLGNADLVVYIKDITALHEDLSIPHDNVLNVYTKGDLVQDEELANVDRIVVSGLSMHNVSYLLEVIAQRLNIPQLQNSIELPLILSRQRRQKLAALKEAVDAEDIESIRVHLNSLKLC